MQIKHFNDVLALVLIFLIVALWILEGLGTIAALSEVSGATIAAFTLIIQYYFRKSPILPTTTSSTTTTSTTNTPAPGTPATPATPATPPGTTPP